jgi:hypothetical protein
VTVSGAPRQHVLYQEVGLKESYFGGVGGGVCRRGDSRQYNARNRYYRSLAISGLTRLFGLHSPTGLKTSGGSLEHQGPRIEMQPWRALSVGKRC